MNWKKFGKIALMTIVVAFIAQAGLRLWWPQPEMASAVEIRYVFLEDNILSEPVLGAGVQFSVETATNVWTEWVDADEDDFGLGEYKYTFQSIPLRWRVRVLLPWHGDMPGGDTQTFWESDPETFEWTVFTEIE